MKVTCIVVSRALIVTTLYEQFDQVLTSEGEASPAEMRNWCMGKAKGDVIVFIDDDARPLPGYVEEVRRIMADPSVVACGGPSLPSPDATALQRLMHRVMASASDATWLRYSVEPSRVTDWRCFAGCSLAVRASCPERWDQRFPRASGEDMDYLRRVSKHGRMVYSPSLAVYHNPHGLWSQLRRVWQWGRDDSSDNANGSKLALLFPLLWCAFAVSYGLGKIGQLQYEK